MWHHLHLKIRTDEVVPIHSVRNVIYRALLSYRAIKNSVRVGNLLCSAQYLVTIDRSRLQA